MDFFEQIIAKIQSITGCDREQAEKIFQQLMTNPVVLSQLDNAKNDVAINDVIGRVETLEQQTDKMCEYLDKFIGYLNLEDRVEDKMRYLMEQFKDEIKDELAELRTVELTKGSLNLMGNELELYTVNATGESGMSQSALARLAGVTQQAISHLEKTLTKKVRSEYLKSYAGQDFYLTNCDYHILVVDGKDAGNLTLYKADYCGAVIAHYAMKGNQTAFQSMAKFCSMGITKWIQGITGWSK